MEERGVFVIRLDGGPVVLEAREARVDSSDVFFERAPLRLVVGDLGLGGVNRRGRSGDFGGQGLFGRGQLVQSPPGRVSGSIELLEGDQSR
jgi:hypothetical protein